MSLSVRNQGFRATAALALCLLAYPASGQTPAPARAAAPWDITGYWVPLVTDDWRYRMLTPPKGNVDYLPVTAEARKQAQAWDPAKDEAAGEACKAYGAGGILRLPGRLHITWEDSNTLKMDIDTGQQTRRFFFAGAQASAPPSPTLQGYSTAQWEMPGAGRGFAFGGRGGQPPPPSKFGQLKITTTSLKPGYVRKNGVPYGADAVITEYFAHLTANNGQEYLAVTVMVDDPKYFLQPYIKTYEFKRQQDASGWNPAACVAK